MCINSFYRNFSREKSYLLRIWIWICRGCSMYFRSCRVRPTFRRNGLLRKKEKSRVESWKKLFQAADVNVPFRERSRPHYIFSAFKYDEQNRRWHPCVRLACPLGVLQSPLTSTINDLSPCPSPLIPVVGVRATVERTRVQRCSESHFCDTHVPG